MAIEIFYYLSFIVRRDIFLSKDGICYVRCVCEVYFVVGCDVNKVNKKGEYLLFLVILLRVDIKVRIRFRFWMN